MLNTHWIPTDEYYHRILDAPDEAARRQLYLDLLVRPWQPMMSMLGSRFGADESDPLSGARAWAWLLPHQTGEMQALLAKLETAQAWQIGREALQRAAGQFEAYADHIPFDSVEGWLALADPARANTAEGGYTGGVDWTYPRFVGQFWDPNERNLPRLPALVAHEMHHLIRLRAFPWGPGTSVGDYLVIEGTAEAFAASLFGEDRIGWFVTDFDPAGLETARRLIGPALAKTGFHTIRGYIFGDASAHEWGFEPVGGMPAYGGYAVGYHVVRAFLERTGTSIEAATFLPAAEIIQGSGYFG
jgi:uncharacterized protein YjaZ